MWSSSSSTRCSPRYPATTSVSFMCLAVLFVHDALSTPLPSIFIYSLCYTKREGNGEDRKWDREKRNSEAGNRTPVVRVTGGNTKPLYYFGSVNPPKLDYTKQLLLSLDNAMNKPRQSHLSIGILTRKRAQSFSP